MERTCLLLKAEGGWNSRTSLGQPAVSPGAVLPVPVPLGSVWGHWWLSCRGKGAPGTQGVGPGMLLRPPQRPEGPAPENDPALVSTAPSGERPC